MVAMFGYQASRPEAIGATYGFRTRASLVTALLLALCAAIVGFYRLDKKETLRVAGELSARRGGALVALEQPAVLPLGRDTA